MANMSYCRFRKTLSDLEECRVALVTSPARNPINDLTAEERAAAIQLIRLCRELADTYGSDE